ncbi:DUF6252 family protein [Flavobacterium sp.]|uniref:DUF6252 family protein n=1 Tax=Flavobacterium sp. TaxID=239 RepID=UPI00248882F4|nr:DUF6252 family protein [Flavobacterium sp.]MDI1317167.1 DUF6252 family protein [Flavobacterium sp.]
MKNIKFLAGLFLLITAFISCDVEPIDSAIDLGDFENPTSGPAVFKADFSGTTWTATTAQANITTAGIQLTGSKANGEKFAFALESNTVGTYPANANFLTFTPAGSSFGYWSINVTNAAENTGSITISSINTVAKTISGTFNFKGYWSDSATTAIIPVQFTNGVFTNIPYVSDSTPPVGDDTFFAKVDGVEFVENQIDVALIQDATPQPIPDQISIVGSKTNDDTVGINVNRTLGVGTYAITGVLSDTDVVRGSIVINDVLYNAESGSITIVSKTATRISGTFTMGVKNFTTSATKAVTEGTFNVELP